MPKRHGIFQSIPTGLPKGTRLTIDQVPVFRYGIWQVFEALRAGPFLPMSDRGRPAKLEQHFGAVSHRFVYSLQHLNRLMQLMAANFECKPFALDSQQIYLEAGCQADHVLTYLNMIVDDIAQVIVLATGVTDPKQRTESMGDLKHPAVIGLSALAPVHDLLIEMNNPGTWWELAFKPHHGARQLLIHNHYVVTFNGAQSPGGPMEAKANLISAYQEPTIDHDFFRLLRDILTSLCEWLDRLEDALVRHLQTLNSTWKPLPQCPCIHLGLGLPMSGVSYHPLYFPLPLCDGADPLPWTYGPPVREGAEPPQLEKSSDAEPLYSPGRQASDPSAQPDSAK
ncbi:MAG: hypothetical protein U0796_02885 [Gemmatales bacterium]